MKNFTLTALILVAFNLSAQQDTKLRIYHFSGNHEYQDNLIEQNNLGQDYKPTRVAYYLSKFTVVHDGGQETAVSEDTIGLVEAGQGPYSEVALGSLNISNVEAIKFYIGVPKIPNGGDPSVYPSNHPLAPQNPSMHWGWAAGYRFLVYEGVGGANFSQTFQLHALWDTNYFEQTVPATGHVFGNQTIIAIDGDYVKGLNDIDVSQGIIAHGIDTEDLEALINFRNIVFTNSVQNVQLGVDEIANSEMMIYPNPMSGEDQLHIENIKPGQEVRIVDLTGRVLSTQSIKSNQTQFSLDATGVFIVQLYQNGELLDSQKVVRK